MKTQQQANDSLQRSVLPIPDRKLVSLTTYDAKDPDTKFPPITPLRPPTGAPNVLVILLDDVGFGASSAFGGPSQTPNAEKLASTGLKYNRFHTTALCSPTRAAMLSGRNHHAVGMGGITEIATSVPVVQLLRPTSRKEENWRRSLRAAGGRLFTVNEGFDIGCDTCSPVSDLYESPFAFTGEIIKVMVDISKATFEELAEQHEARARFAMATQ